MSRTQLHLSQSAGCFPRVSGDEPGSSLTYQNINEFSPRERG